MKISAGTFSRLMAVLLLPAMVVGCEAYNPAPETTDQTVTQDTDIVANSYQAAERLLHGSQQPMDMGKPILVASLVNVANLERSSNMGRIISEQISSRLTQLGYATTEMKFRGSFLIKRGAGEFVLSRELRDISQRQDAQAVITGVYAVAKTTVFVTLRLIRAEDSKVIASYDYSLPLGPDTMALLSPFNGDDF
jgi:TolB-like protein